MLNIGPALYTLNPRGQEIRDIALFSRRGIKNSFPPSTLPSPSIFPNEKKFYLRTNLRKKKKFHPAILKRIPNTTRFPRFISESASLQRCFRSATRYEFFSIRKRAELIKQKRRVKIWPHCSITKR